jgi:hypothetical protein
MILFAYAKDVDYEHGKLTLTLEFFNDNMKTDISLAIRLEDEIIKVIEDLLNKESIK